MPTYRAMPPHTTCLLTISALRRALTPEGEKDLYGRETDKPGSSSRRARERESIGLSMGAGSVVLHPLTGTKRSTAKAVSRGRQGGSHRKQR